MQNEILAAAPEILSHAFGASERNPHPLAERLRHESFTAIARACGAKARTPQAGEPDRSIIARGLTSADFLTALAEGARPAMRRRFDATARHLAFTTEINVSDFREQSIPAVDNAFELAETFELAELETRPVQLTPGVKQTKIRTFGRIIKFERSLLENDQVGIVSGLLAAVGDAAARLESTLVYTALETNPNLDDNGPVFHADHGNLIAAALDETQFAAAVDLLASQADSTGTPGDLQPRTLVVCSDLAVPASKMLRETGYADRVTLVPTAHLPQGRWYLMSDKQEQPVVGVLRLDGRNTLQLVPAKSTFTGVAFRVLFDTEAVMLGRTGIVRGGA